MLKLEENQHAIAQALFAELAEFHLCADAVLAGTAPGQVWVDSAEHPRVGFMIASEGCYLAGDAEHATVYAALKDIIPARAYLILHPDGWEKVLDEIWKNPAARRHPRQHMVLRQQIFSDWRDRIPDGFQLLPIDQALLDRTDYKNHAALADWVSGWRSPDYFMRHGFGFCLLYQDAIASWCIADCVNGHKCEIGITTDIAYRRRGLAAIVVAAAVEHALAHGLTQIGWQCLCSNAGSIAVAEKVGFAKERNYAAYSAGLPTENATDLAPAQYQEWAEHYERAIQSNFSYAFNAAAAWALAGDTARALTNLQRLMESGWQGRAEWLEDNWQFASIQGTTEFQAMVARLRQVKAQQ